MHSSQLNRIRCTELPRQYLLAIALHSVWDQAIPTALKEAGLKPRNVKIKLYDIQNWILGIV